MSPKAKYTREEIVQKAFEMTREKGIDSVVVRELGRELGTSSSPIFTAFKNMEELYLEVRKHEMSQNFDGLIEELRDTVGVCIDFLQKDYALSRKDDRFLFRQVWMHTFSICVLVAGKVCHFTPEEISEILSVEFQGTLMVIKAGNFKPVPISDVHTAVRKDSDTIV